METSEMSDDFKLTQEGVDAWIQWKLENDVLGGRTREEDGLSLEMLPPRLNLKDTKFRWHLSIDDEDDEVLWSTEPKRLRDLESVEESQAWAEKRWNLTWGLWNDERGA